MLHYGWHCSTSSGTGDVRVCVRCRGVSYPVTTSQPAHVLNQQRQQILRLSGAVNPQCVGHVSSLQVVSRPCEPISRVHRLKVFSSHPRLEGHDTQCLVTCNAALMDIHS